jgi:hypothetical protein
VYSVWLTDDLFRLIKHLEKISAESAKVLIFVGTKRVADDLTKYLRQDGWPALAIHGDKQQQERDWVMNEFKGGRSPILIATDVASRGLGKLLCSVSHFQRHVQHHGLSPAFDDAFEPSTTALFLLARQKVKHTLFGSRLHSSGTLAGNCLNALELR